MKQLAQQTPSTSAPLQPMTKQRCILLMGFVPQIIRKKDPTLLCSMLFPSELLMLVWLSAFLLPAISWLKKAAGRKPLEKKLLSSYSLREFLQPSFQIERERGKPKCWSLPQKFIYIYIPFYMYLNKYINIYIYMYLNIDINIKKNIYTYAQFPC